jgi:uncharacterized protein with PQ loop repeat
MAARANAGGFSPAMRDHSEGGQVPLHSCAVRNAIVHPASNQSAARLNTRSVGEAVRRGMACERAHEAQGSVGTTPIAATFALGLRYQENRRQMNPIVTELIGWSAAAILLATLARQVYSQWKSGADQGVSRWLFVGQLAASTGFIVYSTLLDNWVFVVTNALILLTALAGEWVYLYNRRGKARPG